MSEIKDELSFNIIKHEKETDFKKDKNSLTITSSSNNELREKNLLILNDLPMPIDGLIELININLIKLKFNLQSNNNVKDYVLNLNTKFIKRDKLMPFRGTLSVNKAKKLIGYRPKFSIEKGVPKLIRWYANSKF